MQNVTWTDCEFPSRLALVRPGVRLWLVSSDMYAVAGKPWITPSEDEDRGIGLVSLVGYCMKVFIEWRAFMFS